jgi:hypothetical protein
MKKFDTINKREREREKNVFKFQKKNQLLIIVF